MGDHGIVQACQGTVKCSTVHWKLSPSMMWGMDQNVEICLVILCEITIEWERVVRIEEVTYLFE
jgi:hypothetical protein